MSQTGFDPGQHGFAFGNSFSFDETERRLLRSTFARYLALSPVIGVVGMGPLGGLVAPIGVLVLRRAIASGLAEGYGLCGGMAFAALDAYQDAVTLPQDADRPRPGGALRRYLWKRQIDSFARNLGRFLYWIALLHYLPARKPFRGGPAGLLARSQAEWAKLQGRLDQGQPVPLGLVRDTKNVFADHQVLAIGYEVEGEDVGTVHVYDPNCPGRVSQIEVAFSGEEAGLLERCAGGAALRGFFCEAYRPVDVQAAFG
jgi:hypothetical protein